MYGFVNSFLSLILSLVKDTEIIPWLLDFHTPPPQDTSVFREQDELATAVENFNITSANSLELV